jgi:hypothetical protein
MNSQTYDRQIRHRLTVLRHAEEISFNVASILSPLRHQQAHFL